MKNLKPMFFDLAKFGEPIKCEKSKEPSRLALSTDTESPELMIYGDIGGWWDGPDTLEVVKELASISADEISVRINSPGGSVFDGVAIYNALAIHSAKVNVKIEGAACSIASVIAMAGDEISIGAAADMMIHKPWSYVQGDAEAMRKEAEILDMLEGGLVDIYAARTGNDPKEIGKMLAAETWFRGQAAVDAGFADVCVPAKKKAQAARSQIYALFKNAPAELAALADDDDIPGVRQFEQFLRNAIGMSADHAKAVASAAKKFAPVREAPAIADRDDPAPTVDASDLWKLANHIRKLSK